MLVSTVELYYRTKRAASLGLTGLEGIGLDWPAIIERNDNIVGSWSEGADVSLEKKGIAILRGQARFTGPTELEVDQLRRRVTASRFVIATGSSPGRPAIEGIENTISSDGLLNRKHLPDRMAVIGGGVIAMELGFCLARAGTKVTVLQKGPQVLPGVDTEIREALEEIAGQAGIKIHTDVKVVKVDSDRSVTAEIEGRVERFPSDVVLVATGRPPNVAPLQLKNAGVELNRGGVRVNEFLQSPTAPHVFAAGDVIGAHQHTPVAWYEGQLAAHNALKGTERKLDLGFLPTAIFTIPAMAQVGLTEADARDKGLQVAVKRLAMQHNPAAGVRDEKEGLVKIVCEEKTDRLLGVHVLGAGAEDLVQIAAVAMRGGLTRADVSAMHYVFPTLGGAIFDAMAASA